MKRLTAVLLSASMLLASVPLLPAAPTVSAAAESVKFEAEKFFVVVGTYDGHTQLRYFYPVGENKYDADKVVLTETIGDYRYGDVLTASGTPVMKRVASDPTGSVYAMAYYYALENDKALTKVGNCSSLLERKDLTVTSNQYDGSGHFSIQLTKADGTEYYYGLNTYGSTLGVNLANVKTGEVVPFALYKGQLVVPLEMPEETTAAPTQTTDFEKPIVSDRPKGDANLDGTIDILDVIALNKHLLGVKTMEADAQKASDMNGDGNLDASDSLAVLKSVLGLPIKVESDDKTVHLSELYTGASVKTVEIDEQTILGQTRFALDLLRGTAEPGKNTLVSPYSVSQALGMTANGACDKTLSEMENVLGGSMSTLNPAFYTMRVTAPQGQDAKLSTANSIWVRNGYAVREDFLQTNADYYAADAYSAPFDDTTVTDVNNWVNEKTDQMIPTILKRSDITETTQIILVNAVAFDAKWVAPYDESQVQESTFTAADGTKQKVQMMSHTVNNYLEDTHVTGFLQYYEGEKYAFAAILPEEGMMPEAYLADLTPERLHKMLANPAEVKVETGIPQFQYDFDASLVENLKTMGMPTAFTQDADFLAMTDDPCGLYIGDVIHKTHIEVTPVGTRAGAATAVVMRNKSMPISEDTKKVILDRPFVYAIVDTQTSLPVFIGIVHSIT